jgi:hypothetical protein
VLTAYIDESGQEQQDKWMFVAGYVGDETQWNEVERRWRAAIAPRRHLHMKRLRFARESERKMLVRVAEVIRISGLQPVVGGIRQRDYLPNFKGAPEEKLLNGYVACCFAWVVNTLRNLPPSERLEIVFEMQDRYERLALAAMGAIAEATYVPGLLTPDGISKLASWRFVRKDAEALTEIADAFSYSLFQAWNARGSIRAQWCQPILDAAPQEAYGKIWDGATMQTVGTLGIFLDRTVKEAQRRMRRMA